MMLHSLMQNIEFPSRVKWRWKSSICPKVRLFVINYYYIHNFIFLTKNWNSDSLQAYKKRFLKYAKSQKPVAFIKNCSLVLCNSCFSLYNNIIKIISLSFLVFSGICPIFLPWGRWVMRLSYGWHLIYTSVLLPSITSYNMLHRVNSYLWFPPNNFNKPQ